MTNTENINYTKEQFTEDLFEVASAWVDGIMCDLAERRRTRSRFGGSARVERP